ncbi:outer membrane beta-barrel protein [Cyclobacterium jeungdonense]|uniref:Outer membrane beta-barrel protein n=1 Tax=Cyclobacterium jeungdonense TaxID=708087 RepID=A0ABT8C955_9BACT|nr:outer membrane beta-barrel protein [Cyclobacterium jeungdonense]MDN3688353.1 outer membrane beta-barrel protein [Cyclobacterium jeungdonense]
MKHFLLILIFVSGFSNAFAQFNRGDWFAGGSFGLSFNTSELSAQRNSSDFNINLDPNLGYFISESAAIGFVPQISFSRSSVSDVNMENSSTNRLSGGMGIFYRKYFTVADKFHLFFEPRLMYIGSNLEGEDFRYLRLSISPGAAYRISPKWMVEASLGGLLYSRSVYSSGSDQESKDSRFTFDLITTNSIGIVYFFKQAAQ